MKKITLSAIVYIGLVLNLLTSCEQKSVHAEDDLLEVIGEAERQMPEAGYRINLSYNGPMDMRQNFITWADSLQQVMPSMVRTNESIYVNYMPEQIGKRPTDEMYQTSVTYILVIEDSTSFSSITKDLLQHNFPFSVNVSGTMLDSGRKTALQKALMQEALNNAKRKLDFLNPEGRKYEITSIEEISNTSPYGPEYYDYNRLMSIKLKVKARLL